jgi:hypothetical protein
MDAWLVPGDVTISQLLAQALFGRRAEGVKEGMARELGLEERLRHAQVPAPFF